MKRTRPLRLERLETRDVPASLWYAQNFDTTAAGSLPANWAQFANDNVASFSAVGDRYLSSPRSLETAGTSARRAAAWLDQSPPADLQVSASVYADSLVPFRVMLRGNDLRSNTPTYYSATLTRGLTVSINRVTDGADATLAQLNSTSYTSGVWVRMTLAAQGTALTLTVQRLDNGQYLAPDGRWNAAPALALSVKDATISGAGFAGLARPARYAGNVSVDDFRIETLGDTTPPTVSIASPAVGASLSGVVAVQANASDAVGVARVEFLLNNQLQATATAAPYIWNFDTRTVANGSATLLVRAYDQAGNVGTTSRTVTIQNAPATGTAPTIPQHYSHIRIAELAYAGTPITAFEQGLLQNSVDLVIPNEQYLTAINSVAPNTPQLTYTNFSNLYQSLLTDWLNYADRSGLNRENAFYHVPQATPYTGGSPSSQPVTWLWDVRRETTNLTSAARNSTVGDVAFGAAGQSLYLGYTDKFRELNVAISTAAAAGWTGVVEYATAVNAAGTPTAWQALPIISNGTNGFRQSGRIAFNPPANWVTAKLNGSASLFYVRVRTLTGGTAPVATTILGRDYVNASTSSAGTMPAFDSAADANGDGYLNDTEYSHRASGKDARFLYESRLFYPYYGSMRFITNPAGLGVRTWAADYAGRYLAANSLADGLFVDNSDGRSPVGTIATIESSTNFTADYAAMLGSVNQAIAPRWLLANTAGYYATSNPVIQQVPGNFEEYAIRALSHTTAQFEDLANQVRTRQALRNPAPYMILDSLPTSPTPGVGSADDPTGRTQIATLAYYYLIGNPRTTLLMFNGGYAPSTSWTQHWSDAVRFNVGQPLADWTVFASGVDPANTALNYKVYQRSYSNALVLYKPLSYKLGVGTGTAADNTATVHQLAGSYRALRNDGTLGPVVTSVTLRNGEGAILIRA